MKPLYVQLDPRFRPTPQHPTPQHRADMLGLAGFRYVVLWAADATDGWDLDQAIAIATAVASDLGVHVRVQCDVALEAPPEVVQWADFDVFSIGPNQHRTQRGRARR